jgi:hypothetical protein
MRIKSATYSIPLFGIVLNILGTFLHELTHFVFALMLNGKPDSFSLFPKRDGNYWTLGSVEISNATWYNKMPIGLAPLSLFIFAYYLNHLYVYYVPSRDTFTDLGFIFMLVILVENAIPSRQDLRVAFSNIFGCAFYLVLMVIIYLIKSNR